MLNIAIIGTGHLGKIHIKCLQQSALYTIIGFYDPSDSTANQIVKTFDIPRFMDLEELIQAVDVVDIVTPTSQHYAIAKLAVKYNKHFFIEKPITETLEQARELCIDVQKKNLKAQVGHVERFNPALLALEEQSINPLFIEAHRLAFFNPRGTDVSVVLDLMIHDLDIILKLIPHPIKSIQASGVAIVSQTADIANVRLEFENAAVVNITASRLSMKNMRKIRIFQKDAYISVDFLDKKTEIVRLHEQAPIDGEQYMELDTSSGRKYLELKMPDIKSNNAIQTELEYFASSILNNTPPKVALEDGYRALQLAHQIEEKIALHLNQTTSNPLN